jgi:DNA-binding response OmpR family regulator
MKLPLAILVVDDDVPGLTGMLELLRNAGYQATGAATFEAARRLLELGPYDLLITDVRLKTFNGLHLVIRGRAAYPDMALIIITAFSDPLLEREAGRHGAAFLTKPIAPAAFLELVHRVLAAARRPRRYPRKRLPGGLLVMIGQLEARMVDMSYGGLRFQIAKQAGAPLPDRFEVELPSFGFSVHAETVWIERTASARAVWCGAIISDADTGAARAWRGLVDALPDSEA